MDDYTEMQETFLSSNAIRIMVVPVGKINQSQFEFYLNIIKSVSTCDIIELSNEYKAGPFPNRNWKDAKISLNFETVRPDSLNKEDSTREDWRVFQTHRRTLGVIGVVLCHQFPDLFVAKKEFANIMKGFPTAIASKCFAFEPMQDQPDLEGGNLVMIPSTTDKMHLNFYIKTQILDFTAAILKELENWVAAQKVGPEHNNILASTDADKLSDPTGKGSKKRNTGRWLKCKGDYSLLSGSHKDAIGHYINAIDNLRSVNDYVWLGGALEGYITAYLVENPPQLKPPVKVDPNGPPPVEPPDEVIEKANEAISCYSKRSMPVLAIEASLRLARYYIAIGKRKDVNDLLMNAYELSAELPARTKISVCSSIGMLFKQINYLRKFAFFIREAAVYYHKTSRMEIAPMETAHNLLKMIAKYYQLQDLDEVNSSLVARTRSKYGTGTPLNLNPRRPLKDKTQRDWHFLQKTMLKDLVKTANGVKDVQSVIRYLVYTMKYIPEYNANDRIGQELIDAVQKLPAFGYTTIEVDMVGIPLLKKITPISASSHLYPIQLNEGSKKSIWLYTPYQKKEEKPAFWVQNEIAEVKLELSNPTNYELPIQSITLSTSGVEFETYNISCVIPPNTPSYEVVVSGKPIGANQVLEIKGVKIRCFNLLCEHPIAEDGTGLTLKEFYYLHQTQKKPKYLKIVNKINVVGALPQLFAQETSTNGSKLKLFEGQKHLCYIDLENIGTSPINNIDVVLHENQIKFPENPYLIYELAEEPEVFTWNKEELQKQLPLLPGQRTQLPINIYGKITTAGGDFTFTYSDDTTQSEFGRSFVLHLPLHIKNSLQVRNFNIVPCALDVGDYQDASLYKAGICLIVCEVLNPTSRTFELDCTIVDDPEKESHDSVVPKKIQIDPHSVKRVILPIKRFTLDPANIPPLREQKGQFVKSTLKFTPEQQLQARLLYWYKHEIAKRLHVLWRCSVLNTVGHLDLLRPNPLTMEMINKLKADLFNFDYILENSPPKNKEDKNIYYPLRQFKTIGFKVHNITSKSMPVHLRVQPFQDLENGAKVYNLGGKLAWVGCLETIIPELQADQSYTLNLTVCFLAAGTYKFLVSCEDTKQKVANVSEILKIEAI